MNSTADEVTYRDATDVIAVHLADREVVHLELTTNWRATENPPLGWRFNQVFREASADPMFRDDEFTGPPKLDSTDFDNINPRDLWQRNFFDEERFNAVASRMLDWNERMASAEPPAPPRFDFTPAVGTSSNHKVSIRLGPSKAVASVDFDEEWALGVKTERITATVMDALARAYEEYTPPVRIADDDGARDELAALRRDTLALLGLRIGKETP